MSTTPAPRTFSYSWQDPQQTLARAKTMSGIEYLRAIAAHEIPGPPIAGLIDLRFENIEPGAVTLTAMMREAHYNIVGTVHGGIATTLLDTAMGCATFSLCPAGFGFTTLELKVNFVRPMTAATGSVRCTGTIVHPGTRIVTSEARISDGAGKLIAHASSTCMRIEW